MMDSQEQFDNGSLMFWWDESRYHDPRPYALTEKQTAMYIIRRDKIEGMEYRSDFAKVVLA